MTFPSSLPTARTPDPMDAPPLRWGVLGTGWIASRFVASMLGHTRQQVVAVGSRSVESAQAFADAVVLGPGDAAVTAHGSYEALVADPDVDVVYVATPHNFHHPHAMLALVAGRHVLVEKPMGLDAAEVQSLEAAAAAHDRFLMEAMWTLYLPKFDVIRQLLDQQALGTVSAVVADMGEHFDAGHRIFRADLAGGPMHDLGTYPVMLATWVLGEPVETASVSTRAPTSLSPSGVDGQTALVMRFAGGGVAAIHTTILGNTPTAATIVGSEATLSIDGPFYQPGGFTLTHHDGRSLRYDEPAIAHEALFYEAAEAARRITAEPRWAPAR